MWVLNGLPQLVPPAVHQRALPARHAGPLLHRDRGRAIPGSSRTRPGSSWPPWAAPWSRKSTKARRTDRCHAPIIYMLLVLVALTLIPMGLMYRSMHSRKNRPRIQVVYDMDNQVQVQDPDREPVLRRRPSHAAPARRAPWPAACCRPTTPCTAGMSRATRSSSRRSRWR